MQSSPDSSEEKTVYALEFPGYNYTDALQKETSQTYRYVWRIRRKIEH